jgi:hypothetical protein
LALRSGRLVATVVSRKTGKHVAVQLQAKRREGKRFRACELSQAERVYIDVPSSEGGGREVGCLHLAGKWAGKILPPWEQGFDQARLWAARRALDVAQGRAPLADHQAELLQGKICLLCGRELTDPESIARNIGPECWRKATGLEAASGIHQTPGEQLDLHDGNAEDGAMGYPVLQHPDGSQFASVPASDLAPLDGGEDTRSQIEAELQQSAVERPAGEGEDADLDAGDREAGSLFEVPADADPREVLRRVSAGVR